MICSGSPLRAGSGVTVDSLTFLDTTFLHDSAEQCTHDRGTRAYFFGKLFEIEIVNLTQRYRPNLNKIMRVSYSFSVLTHPLYSASFGELYARSQSWYASSGPQTAKLIIHLESIRSDLLSALRRRVKIHQKVGRRLSNRGWGFARNSRHGERMCPNGTTPYP